MILGYINSLSEGVFDVDDKGLLYMREGKKNVAGMYSMYYRNMLLEGINTSNKIFVDMIESDGLVFFMGEKLDIHDYGEGMTINLPNSSYVYISGNDHTLNNSNEFKMYPEFILAHELVGHSIPAVISPSDYDSRMDGLAVTSENIIRKETMSPLRPWNTYSKNDWSVNGMTYSLSLVLIRTLFPKINFGQ